MFEAMAMGLVLFFAVLFAGMAVVFVGLRAVGVSSERIGRSVAHVFRVPGLSSVAAFSRRHRKTVGITGTVLAVGLAPFALMGALVIITATATLAAFCLLLPYVHVGVSSDSVSEYVDSDDEESSDKGPWIDGNGNLSGVSTAGSLSTNTWDIV